MVGGEEKAVRVLYRILSLGEKQDGSKMIVLCESTLTYVLTRGVRRQGKF